MPRGPKIDRALLEAALEGLEMRQAALNKQIADLRKVVRSAGPAAVPGEAPKPKRKVSAAARKRMAAAQKKRWAAVRAAAGSK